MPDTRLNQFADHPDPALRLMTPIIHPNNRTVCIGHIGVDKARSLNVATLPRKRSEHWFRGDSTSGLTGYGISEDVIDRLDREGTRDIDRIIIIETDAGRVIEYDFADFKQGTVVAYSPDTNESVIGDDTMRVDTDIYTDQQRVLPVRESRQVHDKDDISIQK